MTMAFLIGVVLGGVMTGYYYNPEGSIQLSNWRLVLILMFAAMLGSWTVGL